MKAPKELKRDYSKDLISVKGRNAEKNYLQVKHRLEMLREMWPEAEIDSECIDHSENHARFRVVVRLPNGALGVGHGSETAGDFPDFFEKAETKALGRALNAAGIGIQYAGDFEYEAESKKEFKGVDSPAARSTPVATPRVEVVVPPDIASITDRDELIKMIQAEQDRIGIDKALSYMRSTGKKNKTEFDINGLHRMLAWAKEQTP